MVKIVKAPNTVLSEAAEKVPKIDKEIVNLIEEMKQALLEARDPEGVGLAAPQVGKSLQIFIIKPSLKSPIQVFINPVIQAQNQAELKTQKNAEVSVVQPASPDASQGGRVVQPSLANPTKLEGCLSLQDIWGTVSRKPQVSISYLDEKGKSHNKIFKGFQAIIIQHEMDHLQGVLFPKRVLEQKGTLYKSHKTEKGEIEFEELEL